MQRQRVHAADRVRGAVEGRSQRPVRRHEEQDAVRQVFPNPALRHREVQVHQVVGAESCAHTRPGEPQEIHDHHREAKRDRERCQSPLQHDSGITWTIRRSCDRLP